MRAWMNKAREPSAIEYIMSTHHNDMAVPELRALLRQKELYDKWGAFQHVSTGRLGSAANCQNAAEASSGQLLLNASDDFECPKDWDEVLINRLEKFAGDDWHTKRIFLAVSDGFRRDKLCTISIETRKYTEFKGHFLCPDYPGIFSDDEATYRAYRDAKDGNCLLLEAKDIVFLHRQHSNDPSVPIDDTYRLQSRPEAYTAGLRLFFERNPRAATDGIRTW
jgi:hypothetical protein